MGIDRGRYHQTDPWNQGVLERAAIAQADTRQSDHLDCHVIDSVMELVDIPDLKSGGLKSRVSSNLTRVKGTKESWILNK